MKKSKNALLIIVIIVLAFLVISLVISTFWYLDSCLTGTFEVAEKFTNSNETWECEELQLVLYPQDNFNEIHSSSSKDGKMIIGNKEYPITLMFTVPGNTFEQCLSIRINDDKQTEILHANGGYSLSGDKFILKNIVWCEDFGENKLKKAVLIPTSEINQ